MTSLMASETLFWLTNSLTFLSTLISGSIFDFFGKLQNFKVWLNFGLDTDSAGGRESVKVSGKKFFTIFYN